MLLMVSFMEGIISLIFFDEFLKPQDLRAQLWGWVLIQCSRIVQCTALLLSHA